MAWENCSARFADESMSFGGSADAVLLAWILYPNTMDILSISFRVTLGAVLTRMLSIGASNMQCICP